MRPDRATVTVPSRPLLFRRLETALAQLANGQGEVLHHAAREWASATFAGTRHTVTLRFSGDPAVAAAEALIAALPEHEFTLPGQIIADATVTAVEHRAFPTAELTVTCELLLLADA